MRYSELFENNRAPLYHALKTAYAERAIRENEMLGTTSHRWWPNGKEYNNETLPDYHQSYWMKGISFTRDRKFALQWNSVVFELDSNLLKQTYKIVPFDWGKTIDPKYPVTRKREKEEFLILEKKPDNFFLLDDDGEIEEMTGNRPRLDTNRLKEPAEKRLAPLDKFLTAIYTSTEINEPSILNHPKYKGLIPNGRMK